jgi:hypothetical protein
LPLENHYIFLDSISIRLIARIKGHKLPESCKISGIEFAQRIVDIYPNSLHVSSGHGNVLGFGSEFVVPYWQRNEDVNPSYELLKSCASFKTIVISISSPKQEILAKKINESVDSRITRIYCLGAAIDAPRNLLTKTTYLIWLGMLFKNPVRGISKLFKTSLSAIRIFLNEEESEAFDKLIQVAKYQVV